MTPLRQKKKKDGGGGDGDGVATQTEPPPVTLVNGKVPDAAIEQRLDAKQLAAVRAPSYSCC